jgi:NADPH:quinone reductase-like Zn-dependent oxidoreductase
MKAYVCRRYGGPEVVELAELGKPTPAPKEALIKIHATTVTSGDWRVRTLDLPTGFGAIGRLALGITGPRQPVLGTELAGVVETIGKDATRLKPGDAVFAFPGAKMGCHAQYRAIAEDGPWAFKPENLSFEEAATISFGGTTALHYLRKANLRAGDKVLVIGASGGVGTALVQLARHFGAEVTGVTSTPNLALVASLGAERCIDYTREDFSANEGAYDIIADTVGVTSFARCQRALKDKGRLLAIAGGLTDMLAALTAPLKGSRRVIVGPAQVQPGDLEQLAEFARSGVLRPVIDRRYEFAQIAEAHAHVETRRKRGSVVVRVDHAS